MAALPPAEFAQSARCNNRHAHETEASPFEHLIHFGKHNSAYMNAVLAKNAERLENEF
jgi:hypothetical protein